MTLYINPKPEHIGIIIGKSGVMRKQIETLTKARIRVINNEEESTVQIKGTEQAAQKAKSAIENLLKDKAKSANKSNPPRQEQTSSDNMCEFSKRGRCNFGASCRKSHSSTKRNRSPSPKNNTPRTPDSPPRKREARPRDTRPRRRSRQEKPNFSILE